MKDSVIIREACLEDASEILNIYRPYVEKTAISFEYEVPDLKEFRERMRKTLEEHPYLVAEENGEIIGYAYTGNFVGRKAYSWSAETTIYIKEGRTKSGVGKRLYQALEDVSKMRNIRNLNACIGYPETEDEYLTKNSASFHAHLGYTLVGTFHNSGFKFGRWYHMIWMEKMIGEHDGDPKEVIPFPDLDKEMLKKAGIEKGYKTKSPFIESSRKGDPRL